MSQASKIALAVIVIAVIITGGVYYWQQSTEEPQGSPTVEPQQSAQPVRTYRWERYKIEFSYPENYNVLQSLPAASDRLYITEEESIPESDVIVFFSMLNVYPQMTVEQKIDQLKSQGTDFSVESQTIGKYQFKKATYNAFFGDENVIHYLTDFGNNGVFEYYVGSQDEADLARTVLASMKF